MYLFFFLHFKFLKIAKIPIVFEFSLSTHILLMMIYLPEGMGFEFFFNSNDYRKKFFI